VLRDNRQPPYLPHLDNPEVLQMGLSPLGDGPWIETDSDLGRYHANKLRQRALHGDRVYRATEDSLPAQRELAALLLDHLCLEQPDNYTLQGDRLRCHVTGAELPLGSAEPLWNSSLWVADDLVIMEAADDGYCLTAASLCAASHWRLEEKFNRSLRQIHDRIPGFHRTLTPRIDRLFAHLRPEHPLVRYNWVLQAGDALNERMDGEELIDADTPLFYRTERQSLVRLRQTGAIAFTIRVYLHPLESLAAVDGALPALFEAIDNTSPPLAAYKGFDRQAVALARYRQGFL
jgi:hypothetical protein